MKRRWGLSLEERIWNWLHKRDECRLREVMDKFDIDRFSASNCMIRLVNKGSVKRTGRTHSVRYRALGRPPLDMRGTSINTLRTLQKYTCAKKGSRRQSLGHRKLPRLVGIESVGDV